ncbi:restriction alleviation protein, Lar family [Sinorhizobium meliloti]|uniref:Lar family restriction alleviation protein n=1 Tax=Rhizobium meliloti TaxID=382 RepID=UPI000FD3AA2F|nr:Lar family restriction alleviation protein [Sinorhizobium meliloti]RVI16107.1 restriction alleviation protein, Lar family [Sinorhizobium meliloti]RVN88453.1 restriction alleviation protein, Lar family [Sinorhizobium meliloti]RVO08685.1 restriction alleviation protein, Lar family [Sinorhizobium meliloti]
MSREVETDMTDTELKPCPFCGSANLRFRDSDIEGWISHVECLDCDDMLGPMSEYKYDDVEDARADAANVWNRRALPRERGEVKEIIAAQVQSVCDWDDRTSPDDHPDHLLITPEELTEILENVVDLAASRIRSCLLDKPEAVEVGPPELYAARICKGIPADCCDYGVIALAEGVEVCRVWTEENARKIARLLNRHGHAPQSRAAPYPVSAADAGEDKIGPHEQALRDTVEPFLDWLEHREEGAHIKEVREGLISVEDVIPNDHVVLGAHPRAQKDQGVLTIGHFRRLRDAYDGNAAPADTDAAQSKVERLVKALEAAETYVIDGVTTAKQNLEMNAAYPARKPRYEAELQEARDIYDECQAARRAALAAAKDKP